MPCLAWAALVATVIGSGVMPDRLANGKVALALLANTLATGAVLVALILTFGRISGAHFNPVVTFTDAWEKGLPWRETPYYAVGQVLGGMTGAVVVHLIFALPAISLSRHVRSGPSQFFIEFVATFGMVHSLGMFPTSIERGCIRRSCVDHRSLLVHCFHFIREPCGHSCEMPQRYVCWHPTH